MTSHRFHRQTGSMRLYANPVLLLTLLLAPLIAAITTSELTAVFGAEANLTGASVSLPKFEFTVVLNSTYALFVLNATTSTPSQVGWIGTGIGSQMSNSDYLIAWPNLATSSAGSIPWTLSHRAPQGHDQPSIASTSSASSTAALFTYVPELSTSDASSLYTVIAYLRPLVFASGLSTTSFKPLSAAKTTFIYASASKSPGKTAESASISQHDQSRASTTLDLSLPISLTNSTSTGSPFASKKAGVTSRDILLAIHGVLGALAFLVLTPIAILAGRYLRRLGATWFNIHASIQAVTFVFLVACCGLGWKETDGSFDAHKALGILIAVLVIGQVALGSFAHRIPAPAREDARNAYFPTLFRKHPVRLTHIFLGIAITVLAFGQIRLGFSEYTKYSDGGYAIPSWVSILFYVLVILSVVAYGGGWLLEAFGRTRGAIYNATGMAKFGSVDNTELLYRG